MNIIYFVRISILYFLLTHLYIAECQITSSPSPKTVCVGKDVDLDWVYGDASNFLTVTWTYIGAPSTVTIIMAQVLGETATVYNNYNVVHKTNGGITLTGVTKANTGSYKINVDYVSATPPAEDTVTITVNDCSADVIID